MFKRGFLFLATNLAVLALVSIVMSILGVNPRHGLLCSRRCSASAARSSRC
jgi:hypothetical protein